MVALAIQVAFALLILLLFRDHLAASVPVDRMFYFWILVIAILFTIIPLYLSLYALNMVDSATIGILMYLNPLINFFIAFTVYKESVTPFQIVGYAVIFVGLVIFNSA